MQKRFRLIISILLIVFLLPSANGQAVKSQSAFKIVGYYSLQSAMTDSLTAVPFDKLTHINLWFLNPDSLGNFRQDFSSLTPFINAAHARNVKVLASIGGGSSHPYYHALLKNDKRATFITNLVAVVLRYNLDGIDVDLEGNDIDENYESFVVDLAAALRSQNKMITAAIAVYYKDALSDKALAQYDFVNVMSYDRTGSWRPEKPGPHADYAAAVEDLEYFGVQRSIPKEKMVLGVPFYGYGFGPELTSPAISMNYKDIVTRFPAAEFSDEYKMPDGKILYYNGITTIKKKTSLAKEKASGIMIWQVKADAQGKQSLLQAINDVAFNANAGEKGSLRLLDWKPKSQLVVHVTEVNKPKFPVIDIHNHLGSLANTDKYISEMNKAGVISAISLDGHSKNFFYKEHLKKADSVRGNRIIVFFAPEWERIDEPNFGLNEAKRLEDAVKSGARGVKVYKRLGLTVKDKTGKVVPVDDARLDPIWAKCGELGIPVLIHVSDPKAFFTPLDEYNERYDELGAHPEWSYYGDEYPDKEDILAQRNRVLAKHKNTIFIGAHVANMPEELATVSKWLDQYPNLYVEIGARISELGRQPNTCRKFMIKYQDRVLFGTDTSPDAKAYSIYYRFLETDDEYFDPAGGHHVQGRWMIYGVHLPDNVLEKIYNKNAKKILSRYKGK